MFTFKVLCPSRVLWTCGPVTVSLSWLVAGSRCRCTAKAGECTVREAVFRHPHFGESELPGFLRIAGQLPGRPVRWYQDADFRPVRYGSAHHSPPLWVPERIYQAERAWCMSARSCLPGSG